MVALSRGIANKFQWYNKKYDIMIKGLVKQMEFIKEKRMKRMNELN